MEHREVQGKAELDGVAWWESDLVRFFISLESLLLDCFKLGSLCIFSDVAIVVTHHLYKEGSRFSLTVLGQDFLVDHVNNVLAVLGKLLLNIRLVLGQLSRELRVLGVLLNSSNSAAGSTLGANQVLESDREEIALV